MHQMPKKKSSIGSLKKPSQAGDKPLSKPVPKPGKLGKEIDDIFAGRKKKKPELEKPEKKETKAEMAKKKRKRNEPRVQQKRTEDGLLVFTEDELGINKANSGDTPLCPFDCNCCF